MKVIPLPEDAGGAYEDFLSHHPGRMLYYSLAYRDLIRGHLGCQAQYFVAVDERGEVHGLLPTMTKPGRYGPVLNSLPFFGSHGGVLADSPAAEAALWEFWTARTADVAAATVILNPFAEQRPAIPWTHEDHRIGSMTKLPELSDVESILGRIDASARRNYRKASRLGLDVREENDAVDVLHDIHTENMQAVNGRVKDLAFFREIGRHFVPGRDYRIYTARRESEVVAALLVFFSGCCAEYFTPGTRLAFRDLQPSALLLVRAMQDAVAAGYRLWNWGGSWVDQESVARFKGKWGGEARRYHYFTRVNAPEILSADPSELAAEYPYFYVYPFRTHTETAE